MSTKIALTIPELAPGVHILETEDEIHQILHQASSSYPKIIVQTKPPGSPELAGPSSAARGRAGSEILPSPEDEGDDDSKLQGNLGEIECKEKRFIIEFQSAARANALRALVGQDLKIVISSTRRQLFLGMTAQLQRVEGAQATFAFPERVHRIQRRRELRWVLSAGYEIWAETVWPVPATAQSSGLEDLADPAQGPERRNVQIADLSRSGISFVIESEEEASCFSKGLILPKVKFQLRGRTIVADCEVMSGKPGRLPKGRGFKIGVRFIRIEEEDADFVQDLVVSANLHLAM